MSFQKEKLNKFLDALKVVKQDYTCGFCSELCQDPVTLSTCFHMICSAHFDSLSRCPTCNVELTDCTVYKNDNLQSCIDSVRELSTMVQCFPSHSRTEDSLHSHDENSKRAPSKCNTVIESSKFNKENKAEKSKTVSITGKRKIRQPSKANENLNSTILSSSSLKINSIEKKNSKGETVLHVACRIGVVDKVLELLKQGANTNTKDNAGWTPLHEVVQNGNLDLVRLLLKHNTLIDVPGHNNETPLHEAIRYNHQDIAVELVKHGANTNARNCKGETPLMLASDELKSILQKAEANIVQTQSINILLISELHSELCYDYIRVHCISTVHNIHNKLKLLAKHHSYLHIEPKFTNKVTHLVVDTVNEICTSSYDILQAIVNSIWIVSVNWITKSTESKLEPFKDHEVLGVGTKLYNGPRNSRYNKYKQLPGIFNGCHFYLHNFNLKYEISKMLVVTKASLTKLINDAGGIVLRRVPNPELIPESERLVPYHAKEGSKLFSCSHYIIFKDMYEPMYNMTHIKALPVGWLIECIEKYELCEP